MTPEQIGAVVGANVIPALAPLTAAVGAVVATAVRRPQTAPDRLDIWLRWWFAVAVGVGALWIGITFLVVPDYFAHSIGYHPSHFQIEIAAANLGFAAVGFLCVRVTDSAREVGMIGYLIFLWGAAAEHLVSWLVYGDANPGNVGAIDVVDVVVPLVALLLTRARRRTATIA